MPYPVDSDIQALVVSQAGMPLPVGFSFTGYAAAAALKWEEMTGWTPFLADSSPSTRMFDPPGCRPSAGSLGGNSYGGERLLNLGAGFVTLTSLTAVGRVKALGTDFRLLPQNAPSVRRPYSRIEFFCPFYGPADSVVVNATWGFTSVLTADQSEAIIKLGAASAAGDILEGIFASPTLVKTKDEAIQQDSFRELGAGWLAFAERTAAMYRNNCVGL